MLTFCKLVSITNIASIQDGVSDAVPVQIFTNNIFRSIQYWKEVDKYNQYFIHNFGVLDAIQILLLTRYKLKIRFWIFMYSYNIKPLGWFPSVDNIGQLFIVKTYL